MKTTASRISSVLAMLLAAVLPALPASAVDIGAPAPGFTLKDTSGASRSLDEFKGKIVVLEWINHGCPFVKRHYGAGNMQALQRKYTEKGVVWLSICSSAPGKQGWFTPEEAAQRTKETNAAPTAVLLDEDGRVGRLYGARTTPHMFIISADGTLVYQGAIDSNPRGFEGAVNHVEAALEEILAGKPVTLPVTKPYGCSVKYAEP